MNSTERLPHGYNNATTRDGERVTKRYVAPDAALRRRREVTALTRLVGVLPVPPLLEATDDTLVLGFVEGVPGQQALLRRPEAVLCEVGRLARRLAALDVSALFETADPGVVIAHGDFGPQNLLLHHDTTDEEWDTVALLDWEWVHPGRPVADLAWAEWIVRTHHADRRRSLGSAPGSDRPVRGVLIRGRETHHEVADVPERAADGREPAYASRRTGAVLGGAAAGRGR